MSTILRNSRRLGASRRTDGGGRRAMPLGRASNVSPPDKPARGGHGPGVYEGVGASLCQQEVCTRDGPWCRAPWHAPGGALRSLAPESRRLRARAPSPSLEPQMRAPCRDRAGAALGAVAPPCRQRLLGGGLWGSSVHPSRGESHAHADTGRSKCGTVRAHRAPRPIAGRGSTGCFRGRGVKPCRRQPRGNLPLGEVPS